MPFSTSPPLSSATDLLCASKHKNCIISLENGGCPAIFIVFSFLGEGLGQQKSVGFDDAFGGGFFEYATASNYSIEK